MRPGWRRGCATLIEQADGLVLVDAGLPGHLGQLRGQLAGAGHAVGDIRAVLLTHAHPDHTGLARSLQEAGAQIWVHQQDAEIVRRGPRSALRLAKPERSMLPYLLRRPAVTGVPLHLARNGAFTAPGVPSVRTFSGDQRLAEVPGNPQAVTVGGHTPGSTASATTAPLPWPPSTAWAAWTRIRSCLATASPSPARPALLPSRPVRPACASHPVSG
jgi:glyoxylase-like metal-dependent hydrolase (beta-lactamase superfamily II)